jgi:hypothetical protein
VEGLLAALSPSLRVRTIVVVMIVTALPKNGRGQQDAGTWKAMEMMVVKLYTKAAAGLFDTVETKAMYLS